MMESSTQLDDFLALYRSNYSRKIRLWTLSRFFDQVYDLSLDTSERYVERMPTLAQAATRYFKELQGGERDAEADVKAFFISIKDELSPVSIKNLLSGIKVFLEDNGVAFPHRFFQRLMQRQRGGKQTMDRIPTDEELRRIMEHLPLHGRAFFHFLATSGLRIGAALRLELHDLDFDAEDDIVTIKARGKYEKTGVPRLTFASSETKDLLVEWLTAREAYVDEAVNRSRYRRKEIDTRVFPWSHQLAYKLWHRALERTGLDERDTSTGILVLHVHMLRARFRTKLSDAGIQQDYAEALLGHEGYLGGYKKFTDEDLKTQYRRAMPTLLISKHSKEIGRVEERLGKENKELRDQVDAVSSVITKLSNENESLKEQLVELRTLYNFEAKMQTGRYPDAIDSDQDFGDE